MTQSKTNVEPNIIFENLEQMKGPGKTYINADCKEILSRTPDEVVDTIITSPPYGNLKNYGTIGEIGHGQNVETEYLPEIETILQQLYRVTKAGGAMWLVLDMFRYRGQTIALPFELMERARKAGWFFQDMIVWDKGRNLPWSHRGRFRNVSEHILLFSKGEHLKRFNIDELRTTEGLSTYWVKYPERFHPKGKAPSDVWHIPIPTQGSWSKTESAQHFCPFPISLANRMILLTSTKGDIILDPFCGTGSVLVSAEHLGRFGIGFDVNEKYYNDFMSYGADVLKREAQQETLKLPNDFNIEKAILRLRGNKFAATLYREMSKLETENNHLAEQISGLFIDNFKIYQKPIRYSLASLDLGIILNSADNNDVQSLVNTLIKKAPLSKYGVDVTTSLFTEKTLFNHLDSIQSKRKYRKAYFIYRGLRFNKFSKKKYITEILDNPSCIARKKQENHPPIISCLNLDISPVK